MWGGNSYFGILLGADLTREEVVELHKRISSAMRKADKKAEVYWDLFDMRDGIMQVTRINDAFGWNNHLQVHRA